MIEILSIAIMLVAVILFLIGAAIAYYRKSIRVYRTIVRKGGVTVVSTYSDPEKTNLIDVEIREDRRLSCWNRSCSDYDESSTDSCSLVTTLRDTCGTWIALLIGKGEGCKQ